MSDARDRAPGRLLLRATSVGTAAFTATATAAVTGTWARVPAAAVSLVLFVVGTVAFLAAYLVALGRSRADVISVAGLFFLSDGSAPRHVRRWFTASLAVQVVVALATASMRPYTSLAYGVLVPVFGLGMAGLWGARHGTFPPRREVGG